MQAYLGFYNHEAIEVYSQTDIAITLENYIIYINCNGKPLKNIYTVPNRTALSSGGNMSDSAKIKGPYRCEKTGVDEVKNNKK